MFLRAMLLQCVLLVGCVSAEPMKWRSDAVGRELNVEVTLPASATTQPASVAGVVVLKGLPSAVANEQTRREANELLRRDGNALIEIDYANDPEATTDALVKDLLKIRSDLKEKKLVLAPAIDINRLWILPEGVALKRDVPYWQSDGNTWALDIAYPLAPKVPAATLMEITCDNASRMGNFSLVFCRDTLVEGALLRGFAASMIDHPVPAPYKGLDDPMPDLIHRLKSAVRTIRAQSESLGLNGKIAAMGFSRGGPMAAFLAVTNGRPEFEVAGEHVDLSSDVQAALVHGNRYDYSDLLADDPMLARFEKAWGERVSNQERWLAHGAVYYLRDAAAPMFLSSSNTESAEYRAGLKRLHEVLESRSLTHEYVVDTDGRGHTVSVDPSRLNRLYTFLQTRLGR